MTNDPQTDFLQKVSHSIDRGIEYLCHRQLHNGEFLAYISGDEAMQEWCAPDSTNYMTAVIGHCLLPLQHRPEVDKMLQKSGDFFLYQMMRGGTWGYVTRFHWLFRLNAPDVDDTSLISDLLKKRDVSIPDNTALLVSNRDERGLFYTWFTFHGRFLGYSPTFWKIFAREFKYPISNLIFWRKNGIDRNDIDSAINANVIAYLGRSEATEPAIQFLVKLIEENQEKDSDNYYKNPFVFYYFVARLVLFNIQPLVDIRNLIANKLKSLLVVDKENSFNDLNLALASSSLIMLGQPPNSAEGYLRDILRRQTSAGNWKRHAFYSTTHGFFWGCEELTTALCIEALNLYANASHDN